MASSRARPTRIPLTQAEATKRILRAMRNRDFVSALRLRDSNGTIPVLVALTTDLVSDVALRVAARGGEANVIAASERGFFVLGLALDKPVTPNSTAKLIADDVPVVHQNSELGMLIEYMRRTDDPRFRIELDEVKAEATAARQLSLPA